MFVGVGLGLNVMMRTVVSKEEDVPFLEGEGINMTL